MLFLYFATAARDIVFGDAPELTGAAVALGVAHPPGYPLWTMLAHLFTAVPMGTIPFRVSAFSVLAACACVTVVYASTLRLTRNVAASFAAGMLLALTPVFWTWSVVPEVFALHAALAAMLLGLLLSWHLRPRPRAFIAAAFVGGLGMTDQQTIALLGPAVLVLMWRRRRDLRWSTLGAATAAFIAGLLPYAYLPMAASRDPAWNWGDISSGADLGAHVFRTAFGTGQLVADRAFQGGPSIDRILFFAGAIGPLTTALAIAGAVVLFRRDRTWFWFVVCAFVVTGPAFVIYSNVNLSTAVVRSVLERFFLLPVVVAAPLSGIGITVAISYARSISRVVTDVRLDIGLAAASCAAAAALAIPSLPAIDQHENHNARTFAEDILASAPQGTILLASGDAAIWPIQYLRTVEGARPDLTYVEVPLLTSDWYVRQLQRRSPELVLRAPRYDGRTATSRDLVEANGLDRFEIAGGLLDDSVERAYRLIRRGLLFEVRPNGAAVDAKAYAALNDSLLRAYRIPAPALTRGRRWDELVVADYAFIAFDVAQELERQRAFSQARDWYERALSILPTFPEARSALGRLPK